MLEFLLLLIFAAFFIKGFHAITRHGKLLHFIGFDSTKQLIEIDEIAKAKDAEVFELESRINKAFEEVEDQEERDEIDAKGKDELKGILKYYKYRQGKVKDYPKIVEAWSECETCMASIWGTIVISLYYTDLLDFKWHGLPILLITFGIVSLAGLTTLLSSKKE